MCPRWNFRKKLVRFILRSYIYGSLCLGLLPFKFDGKLQKIRPTKWLIVYGAILNSILLWFNSQINMDKKLPLEIKLYQRNPLSGRIRELQSLLRNLTVIIALLQTGRKSEKLAAIWNELLKLNDRYFSAWKVNSPYFNNDVISKGGLFVLQLVSSLFIRLSMVKQHSTFFFLYTLATMIPKLVILFIGLHYYLTLIHIHKFAWILSWKLLQLNKELRSNTAITKSADVRVLLKIYKKLLKLNSRINGIYDYPMTMLMVCLMGGNILATFIEIVLGLNMNGMPPLITYFIFPQATIINFWDFWLGIALCERLEATGRDTLASLKLFCDFRGIDKPTERTLDIFALFCRMEPLRVRHCGLFNINSATGFRMLVTSVLYLLFIVQFDYINLYDF